MSVSGLSNGVHYWNVTCWDLAGNANTSETRWFNVTAPDLMVNAGNITLNSSAIRENDNVTINATIFNIDTGTATNILVQFWDGIPGVGSQMNGNITIPSLAFGQNVTVNVSHRFRIGTTQVYVIVDPSDAILESNEGNNNASRNITVSAFHTVVGNSSGQLIINDLENRSLFAWSLANISGSNIFAVDTDSALNWTALWALGRNLSNLSTFNDFAELDIALNMSLLNDSINLTWTAGNQPVQTINITVYGRVIPFVPVINSTNTSDFQTGILWDSSDPGPGQYNGSQDVIFITVATSQKTGLYGIYDYELYVPARLREYMVPNSVNSVTFYTELK